MKSLINIIQEKLKINSKSKVTDDISDWCIAIPKGKLLKIFSEEFRNCKFEMLFEGGIILNVYVIQSKELKKYINDPNLFIYKIPNNFDNIDDFEMSLIRREKTKFDWDELEDWVPEK